MTEEEAKTKWCPFVRLTGTEQEWHVNRDPSLPSAPSDPQAYRCIASACMAWRWELDHDGTFSTTLSGPDLHVSSRIPNFKPTDRGFCGLAGGPHA